MLNARGLSLEDGAATLLEYTADSLIGNILDFLEDAQWYKKINILLCGGGRKNNFLVSRIKKKTITNKINWTVKLIDSLDIDGDFVESQAFGYLAIRSLFRFTNIIPKYYWLQRTMYWWSIS